MYENFVFSSQHRLFLILEKIGEQIEALQFDFVAYKYGHPNDELSHPLSQYGLGHYGLFKVDNSPWIAEILNSNRQHPRHSDHIFGGCEHYIARFKDVTLEVICNRIEQIQITREYFLKLVETEIGFVENDDRQE